MNVSMQIIFIVLMCSCVSVYTDPYSRTLTSSYNPGCETQKQNCSSLFPPPHLLYTKGVSDRNGNDVLHFVVSGGGRLGPLSMLLIHARGENSELTFNWTKLLSKNSIDREDAIQLVSGRHVFQAGFVITKIWEYNDTDDSANMTNIPKNRSLYNEWDTSKFMWTISSIDKAEKNHVIELVANHTDTDAEFPHENMANIDSSNDTSTVTPITSTEPPVTTSSPKPSPSGLFKNGGKLQFRIALNGEKGRAKQQPRLEFTGNSTQLDFFFDHLTSSFNGSRFGITIVHLASLKNSSGLMDVKIEKSVDDEFTPGIFKMYNWIAISKTVDSTNSDHCSFLQWKPVSYTSPDRHLKMSQQMFNYEPERIDSSDSDELQRSVIHALSRKLSMLDLNVMNISFGQSGDGFYKASNYITWTASMGIGKPPSDKVSILVILVIAIGLGLPFILIIVGSIYICIRRRNLPVVTYEVIN